jgi:alkyldihydroxyacetonephosphate synthase
VSAWRTLDRVSLLVEVDASTQLDACEADLCRVGLTLGLELEGPRPPPGLAIGPWLARGAPGARDPWADPADHLVAGLTATLRDGRTLSIRPAPRRAVGPDLIALVVGMEERYARVERAWLRVHRLDAPRPQVHPLVAERNPPVSDDERALLESITRALSL